MIARLLGDTEKILYPHKDLYTLNLESFLTILLSKSIFSYAFYLLLFSNYYWSIKNKLLHLSSNSVTIKMNLVHIER